MIKIEKTDVHGWEAAVRGMRNPMNSWDKSDSTFQFMIDDDKPEWFVGKNDLKLMTNLSKAGNDHSKYLRMITVTCDITAPLYWWKEFDTYKVGTVANSCSTMHKIHEKEFELDDFSHEQLFLNEEYPPISVTDDNGITCDMEISSIGILNIVIAYINDYRKLFVETKDERYWWQIIQLLPSSYNQKRTVQMNYQVLKNMYHARKNHKLDCWRDFCKWIETLPYAKELICLEVK